MNIFPIFKKFWNEIEDQWEETPEILGYQMLGDDGVVIASGETPDEVQESALISAFLTESNENTPKKVKLGHRMLRPKMVSKTANVAK